MNVVIEALKAKYCYSDLKNFKRAIKALGGKWASDDVYFSQMRDGYSAGYKPAYPKCCNDDMTIQTIYGTGAANRGNYELIVFRDGKFTSEYFDKLDDIEDR